MCREYAESQSRRKPGPVRAAGGNYWSQPRGEERGLSRLPFPDQPAIDERLRDLDGIESRALAQIVRHHPEVQAVLDSRIFADAAHISGKIAHALDRSDVAAILGLIDDE